jgi:alpha-mannosidase
VTDGNDNYGMALLVDHTTNYAHGEDFPLGLTLAYSGVGLWGRNYRLTGPTDVHYSIIPHTGKWDKNGLWAASEEWNEPLIANVQDGSPTGPAQHSLVSTTANGYDITSLNADGRNLLVRVFNAEGNNLPQKIIFDGTASKAELVELDGRKSADLPLKKDASDKTVLTLGMPRFGIRTIKLYNISKL